MSEKQCFEKLPNADLSPDKVAGAPQGFQQPVTQDAQILGRYKPEPEAAKTR